ncbi:hypothetical protein Q1695_008018 [Nippostrongylus brasiliensis]|nr:hypothetical protein Q1695_008018 [Nippostrongylus brasiliensis]
MAYDSSRGSVLESLCAKIVLWNSRTDAVPSDLVVRTIRRRKEYDPVTSDEGIALRLVFLAEDVQLARLFGLTNVDSLMEELIMHDERPDRDVRQSLASPCQMTEAMI